MGHPSRLQISDLETIESGVEQEIPLEEAEKIVGGSKELKEPKGPKDPGWGCIIVADTNII